MASQYSNPYSNPEDEAEEEWESHYSNPYSNPEDEAEGESDRFLGGVLRSFLGEFEDETHEATHYSNPYSNPEMEFEDEWESHEASHYSNPYSNPEVAHYSNPYSNPEMEDEAEADRFLTGLLQKAASSILGEAEMEDEGEFFFKRAFRAIKKIGKRLLPVAKFLAPIAAKALGGMIPGVGAIAGPLAGKLVKQLVKEAEMEAQELENHFTSLFANQEVVSETAHELAHEAALTELMAAEAAVAESEAEAEADIATTLPITITIMGANRSLRRVMPVLAQGNARLVQVLRRQGGRQLLRTIPAINRRTVGILKAAQRRGQPISAPLAIRAMSDATRGVLGNPRLVRRSIERNAALRLRVAPPHPRRSSIYASNMVRRPGTIPAGRRQAVYF